jgi:hypothetical protein
MGREDRTYTSCSFSTLALGEVSGQRHAPAALCPRGKDPLYPLDRRLGGPELVWTERLQKKSSFYLRRTSNLDRPVVQFVAINYDSATPASPPGKHRYNTVKSGHDRFLPHHFQFIIHLSSFH